ncbi:ATP-dependent DNA helicase [Candidatus Woesearchaeota archaeon]|nr:ATP-dependent DNA helicase [Candidatus Woesearchaeota archaeon]
MPDKPTNKHVEESINPHNSETEIHSSENVNEFKRDFWFPFDTVRDIQVDLLKKIHQTIKTKSHLIAHAPTGLGKSAAALAPALKYAFDHGKKVFFLTSRHTQHNIAIDTLKKIKEEFNLNFQVVDMIGKKHMCSVEGIENLYSNEFSDFCKKQKEEQKCEFYTNTKKNNKLTTEAQIVLKKLKDASPAHIEEFKEQCKNSDLCAYEMASSLAKDAQVIVADYYYIFNPLIRDLFFAKSQITLNDCIVIVDEGHNLPDRIRNLMTSQISSNTLKRAIKEAKKFSYADTLKKLVKLQDVLLKLSGTIEKKEKLVSKQEFMEPLGTKDDYESVIEDFDFVGGIVRDKDKRSSIGAIGSFLDSWRGNDEGYVRIVSHKYYKGESNLMISYRCLDPSLVSSEIIDGCHSVILMSGTLTPTSMFRDILGFPKNTEEETYPSPFPEDNKLSMIVTQTTTKFSMRSDQQYKRMGAICANITNHVPGNCAVFFPSYFLRDQVYKTFMQVSKKTAFMEQPNMTKEEKGDFLERFKSYKNSGAVLLGVMSGSYSEGIDLPGDLLKCVVVVGLPLGQPDIETKKLIDYYDVKFGKGWDYGYVAPAFSNCLQSAGRCIRSETDRGLVVFLDERYTWSTYKKHFPRDWNIKVAMDYPAIIDEFFSEY